MLRPTSRISPPAAVKISFLMSVQSCQIARSLSLNVQVIFSTGMPKASLRTGSISTLFSKRGSISPADM